MSKCAARRAAAGTIALVGCLALAACGSSSPGASPTTGVPATGAPPATPPTTSPTAAITAAIVTYNTAAGIEQGNYEISDIDLSSVDPAWAQFRLGPTESDRATFQGGYGYARRNPAGWRVTGVGTADVGCPLTPPTDASALTYVVVPAAVLAAFGQSCPS